VALRSRHQPRSYELGARIAAGGMGEIYRARATDGSREVAIKRVLDADSSDENLRLLFLREVAVAATLEHQNVVEVLDAGSFGGELFLVMELVDGPSLAEVLDVLYREGRLLPVDVACGIVSQIAVGLAHAHERAKPDGTPLGIIHRDVAAENILLGAEGVPKLLDFGLAKLSGHSLTEPGIVRGRPRSLSPEQARGDPVDARSDIFAMGAILFELVSGEQLYPNEAMAKLLFKVAAGDYASIHDRVPPSTDGDLVRIIERAVAVDPDARFGSARNMAKDLAAFRAVRGLRLSSSAIAEVVAECHPKVMALREANGTAGRGALEGRQLVLPADPEAAPPTPRSGRQRQVIGPIGLERSEEEPADSNRAPSEGQDEGCFADTPEAGLQSPIAAPMAGELPLPRRPGAAERDDPDRGWRLFALAAFATAALIFSVVAIAHGAPSEAGSGSQPVICPDR